MTLAIARHRPHGAAPSQVTVVLLFTFACASTAGAAEDIEFVAEHLPEVAMDNRFATLPVWNSPAEVSQAWSFTAQAAYVTTDTGQLNEAGPMLALAVSRAIDRRRSLGAFVFMDTLSLTGNRDLRALQTLFSPNTPFARPVMASFNDLDGRLRHFGGGLRMSRSSDIGWLGAHRWVGGLLWQRVELRDYRLNYQLLDGESAGLSGTIDFDANYAHVTPFVGLELPRAGTRWAVTPHVLAAVPFPRRGVIGHITGPGFDLHGDTENVGEGKHFGDPSLTIGVDVTYLPANFSVDVGTLLTQYLLEPIGKKGIDTNWVLSGQWHF